jgi:hypothetical protein
MNVKFLLVHYTAYVRMHVLVDMYASMRTYTYMSVYIRILCT